jgi:hypothetical protein
MAYAVSSNRGVEPDDIMQAQKILKLAVAPRNGEPSNDHTERQRELRVFSRGQATKKSPETLYAELLKRHAREIMQCIGECNSAAIPANMARLRDIEEHIRFAIEHLLVPVHECGRSDKQLLYASTLADLLECLKITAKDHRAPQVVAESALTGWLAKLERKLDIIAGAIAHDPKLQNALFGGEP